MITLHIAQFKLRFYLVNSYVQTGLILFTAPYRLRSSSIQTEVLPCFQLCLNQGLQLIFDWYFILFTDFERLKH